MSQSIPDSSFTSEDNAALRVLDALMNWSDRLDGHQTQKRGSIRKAFRKKITVFFPEKEKSVGEATDKAIMEVWSRNLSTSGVAFITQEVIKVEKIIVCLQGQSGEPMYFHADIVRSRQVHDQFWEYGALFTERAHM